MNWFLRLWVFLLLSATCHMALLVGDLFMLAFYLLRDLAQAVANAIRVDKDVKGASPLDSLLGWLFSAAAAHYRVADALRRVCLPERVQW